MNRLLFVLFSLWLVSFSIAYAHPGIGIVRDSRGTIFYTDLVHVWKISSDHTGKLGRKQIAVRNVHTHELAIDQQDNLYGEHVWYEGEATDTWGHYVWRLSPNGQLTKVIPNTAGFLSNYSFVRDKAGAMYWVERGTPCRFMKKLQNNSVQTLATGTFSDIRWQYVTPAGQFYFVNDDDLHQLLPNGTFKLIKSDLDEVGGSVDAHNHNVQGIWSDGQRNIYIAVANKRKIQRISPDGRMITVAKSPLLWAPSGGLLAPDGSLWLLEYLPTNQVRVRRIDKQGREQVF